MQGQQKQQFIVDGFSSEEEVHHEEIQINDKKSHQNNNNEKQEVKLLISPPREIKHRNYSLHPDIATGWAPKAQLPTPVPMLFDNPRFDNMIKRLIDYKGEKAKLCFLGPRFENTFYAWYDKAFTFPYSHIVAPQNMKFTNRAFCGQHWEAEDGLIFDSFFQSGNLDCAIRVGQREYDLFLRVDSNTRGHLHWYNFKIKNLEKLQKYKLNICNFQKCESLYGRGMKPYIFSQKKYEKEMKGWEQGGQFIRYETKASKAAKLMNFQLNPMFKLTFQYYTEYDKDEVQFAYCIPYPYTMLRSTLQRLKTFTQKNNSNILQINKLCTSLGGLQVPLLIIHDNSQSSEVPKKCIVISGRAHPGESNGSFMMEGFLQFLCGQSKEARELRRKVVFKIVPMLNPDGVALGNYRTGLSGKDFNREYKNPDKGIFPEVHAFKKLVIENKSIFKENLLMFLDFHGHSIKKNIFMYGPQFPIIQRNYYECRVFPKILSNHTKMFRYYSCSFKISSYKENTARAIFLRRIMIPFSYTIQASNGSFYDYEKLKDFPFNDRKWISAGSHIGSSLAEYMNIIYVAEKNRLQKNKEKKKKKEGGKSTQKLQQKKQVITLTGIQDEKMKNLFQQIKIAEERKQFQKNSDDQISEGSSDNEGKEDDLPPQKMNELYQAIKKKKFDFEEIPKTQRLKQKTQGYEKVQIDDDQVSKIEDNDEKLRKMVETQKRARKVLYRNKQQTNIFAAEKEHKTAKIINFSFISSKKPYRNSDIMASSVRNRSNLFQIYMNEKNEKKNCQPIYEYPNSSVVLDLSTTNQERPNNRSRKEEKKFNYRNILRKGYSLSLKAKSCKAEDSNF